MFLQLREQFFLNLPELLEKEIIIIHLCDLRAEHSTHAFEMYERFSYRIRFMGGVFRFGDGK